MASPSLAPAVFMDAVPKRPRALRVVGFFDDLPRRFGEARNSIEAAFEVLIRQALD